MPWEGDGLTRTAQEMFDGRACAATSRQHSALVWGCAARAARQVTLRAKDNGFELNGGSLAWGRDGSRPAIMPQLGVR